MCACECVIQKALVTFIQFFLLFRNGYIHTQIFRRHQIFNRLKWAHQQQVETFQQRNSSERTFRTAEKMLSPIWMCTIDGSLSLLNDENRIYCYYFHTCDRNLKVWWQEIKSTEAVNWISTADWNEWKTKTTIAYKRMYSRENVPCILSDQLNGMVLCVCECFSRWCYWNNYFSHIKSENIEQLIFMTRWTLFPLNERNI